MERYLCKSQSQNAVLWQTQNVVFRHPPRKYLYLSFGMKGH